MAGLVFNIKNIEADNRTNPSFNAFSLKNLKILSQNLNSLNVSTRGHSVNKVDKYKSKLCHILKTSNELIFVQDVRLGSNQNLNDLKNDIACTKYGNYTSFFI